LTHTVHLSNLTTDYYYYDAVSVAATLRVWRPSTCVQTRREWWVTF